MTRPVLRCHLYDGTTICTGPTSTLLCRNNSPANSFEKTMAKWLYLEAERVRHLNSVDPSFEAADFYDDQLARVDGTTSPAVPLRHGYTR